MIIESKHSVTETLDRLTDILAEKGISIAVRISHSAAAAKVGMELRPTEVMWFGNPNLGTPIMQKNQEAGFDLPMRAFAWQDEIGKVLLRVTDPAELQAKHQLTSVNDVIEKMITALGRMAHKAAN